jgi:hypothetical protein
MERLNPEKLRVTFSAGTVPEEPVLPRRYTLTHSDRTGDLFLTIGNEYDKKQTAGLYTRLMRDEVLAELINNNNVTELNIHCHVSGGLTFGPAAWRYKIFQSELPLVLETIRYGDRALFERNPELDKVEVFVHFQSKNRKYHRVENRGPLAAYR